MKKKMPKSEEDATQLSLIQKFKLFFKGEFFKNPLVFWLSISSLVANMVNWAIIGFLMNRSGSEVILHYNVYFGVDMIGNWKRVFWLPLIGLLLLLINFLLSYYFFEHKERIASHVLMLAAFMAQLSLIIASSGVIMINY